MVNIQIDSTKELYKEIFENTLRRRKIFRKTRRACPCSIITSKLNLFNLGNGLEIQFLMAIFITKISLFNL